MTSRTPAPAATAADSHQASVQRRILGVLVLAQIIGTVGVGVAPSIGVLLAEDVTNSEVWAGLARMASTLGAAFFGLPLGSLAARRGRRVALSAGWLAAASGAAMLVGASQWQSALLLFPGLVLIGIGSAVALQSRFAATDRALPHQRGRALAFVVWVGTLGSVIGPNLGIPGGWIRDATGLTAYAGAFLIAAAALGGAGLVVALALRPEPLSLGLPSAGPDAGKSGGAEPSPRSQGMRQPMRELVTAVRSSKRAGTAVLAIVTAQVVMVSVMTMTPVHLHHHGGTVTIIGLTISVHIVGMYALAPIVGVVIDRKSARFAVATAVAILAAALLLAVANPESTATVVVALVLLGIGWSFTNVAGSALFNEALTTPNRARAQGAVDALANLCGAAAAFLSGPFLAVSGFAALALAGLVALVPLVLVTTVPGRWREPGGIN
ncbi:MFS transporter [Arthrobacter sp. SLBN-83]|uniref:MFS transporter n=1 Tax=Arthrobacter sp. SLBN-83 TaxID=2768449 RepID=UPI0011548682|nr:MFS transporter [Arthrobacter sp. SLBN-83]TQJ58454.1 MFS transporter [Arthrobacter sp. SLBN-83]